MSEQGQAEFPAPERDTSSSFSFRRLAPLVIPLAYYVVTSSIVFLGIWLGTEFFKVRRGVGDRFSYHGETYANWDGQWYKAIVEDGYSYSPRRRSNVAFFPAYPLLARVCARLTGLRAEQALLLVSNLFLILSFYGLHGYSRERAQAPDAPPDYPQYVLLGFGLVPVTFFFRTAYSESLFVFASLLVLRAMARRRDPLVVAALVGFATATRPVGVALIPPLLLYAWDHSPGTAKRLGRIAIALPIAVWGLADYMLYLGTSFGDPLAFSHAQAYWAARRAASASDKLLALVSLEPFRTLFDPSSPGYWKAYDQNILRVVSLHWADPLYFLGTAALVAVGAWKRWLDRYEVLLASLLLLIPYVSSSYETYNRSIGRYASVAVPAYLVLGRLLVRVPAPLVGALAGLSGFLLGTYAGMFASWQRYL